MKKNLLSLIIFISFYSQSKGQSYTPFSETTAFWQVYHRPDNGQPSVPSYYHNYKMAGDTVIGSRNYNKIYKYDYYGYTSYIPLSGYNYYAGIRQDSVNKKVFAIFPSDNIDTLLYDFNLNVGDTLPPSYTRMDNAFGPGPFTVTSIDSVSFYGHQFKQFNISGAMSGATLIEGIGNANGLFEGVAGFFEAGYEVTNYCNSEESDCHAMALGIKNIENKIQIDIYPNPFNDKIIIICKETVQQAEIYNVLGIRVYNKINVETEIDLTHLSNGIYFLKVTTTSGSSTKRLIKE